MNQITQLSFSIFYQTLQLFQSCFSNKKRAVLLTLFPFFLFLSIVTTGCQNANTPISKSGFYFNTIITLTVYNEKDASKLDQCLDLCESYETMLSRTLEGSDIYQINHSDGKPVTASNDTILLLKTAEHYSKMTNGLISITVAPLMDLWDFTSTKEKKVPSEKAIDEALKHVDDSTILINGNTVTLADPDAAIDLGFIAKGYIADKLKEYLLSEGITSAIINLGGNVVTVGNKPDGSSFYIGIQKPFDTQNTVIATLPVNDLSFVSSGIYERYFKQNNKIYHHILNPSTGYPVRNNLLGVTILSESSMTGDALSTTCFVLGLDKGMELIESLDQTEAVFITDDYKLHVSSGLSGLKIN